MKGSAQKLPLAVKNKTEDKYFAVLLGVRYQLDVEDQVRIPRNKTGKPPLSVCQMRWNRHLRSLSHTELRDTHVKPWNDLFSSEFEPKGLPFRV